MVQVLKLNQNHNQISQILRTKTKIEIKVPPMCEIKAKFSLIFYFKKEVYNHE
jgi:hypothetical protein